MAVHALRVTGSQFPGTAMGAGAVYWGGLRGHQFPTAMGAGGVYWGRLRGHQFPTAMDAGAVYRGRLRGHQFPTAMGARPQEATSSPPPPWVRARSTRGASEATVQEAGGELRRSLIRQVHPTGLSDTSAVSHAPIIVRRNDGSPGLRPGSSR